MSSFVKVAFVFPCCWRPARSTNRARRRQKRKPVRLRLPASALTTPAIRPDRRSPSRTRGCPATYHDWIAIAPAGSPNTSVLAFVFTNGQTSGTATFSAPADGSYVARAFANDDYILLAESAAFTVSSTTISTDQSSYTSGSTITVTYAGLPGNLHDWIAIAPAGSPNTSVLAFVFTNGQTSGTATFTAPADGSYVARAFANDDYILLAESAAFTVVTLRRHDLDGSVQLQQPAPPSPSRTRGCPATPRLDRDRTGRLPQHLRPGVRVHERSDQRHRHFLCARPTALTWRARSPTTTYILLAESAAFTVVATPPARSRRIRPATQPAPPSRSRTRGCPATRRTGSRSHRPAPPTRLRPGVRVHERSDQRHRHFHCPGRRLLRGARVRQRRLHPAGGERGVHRHRRAPGTISTDQSQLRSRCHHHRDVRGVARQPATTGSRSHPPAPPTPPSSRSCSRTVRPAAPPLSRAPANGLYVARAFTNDTFNLAAESAVFTVCGDAGGMLCFVATLSGAEEVPPHATTATGAAVFVFDPATRGDLLSTAAHGRGRHRRSHPPGARGRERRGHRPVHARRPGRERLGGPDPGSGRRPAGRKPVRERAFADVPGRRDSRPDHEAGTDPVRRELDRRAGGAPTGSTATGTGSVIFDPATNGITYRLQHTVVERHRRPHPPGARGHERGRHRPVHAGGPGRERHRDVDRRAGHRPASGRPLHERPLGRRSRAARSAASCCSSRNCDPLMR